MKFQNPPVGMPNLRRRLLCLLKNPESWICLKVSHPMGVECQYGSLTDTRLSTWALRSVKMLILRTWWYCREWNPSHLPPSNVEPTERGSLQVSYPTDLSINLSLHRSWLLIHRSFCWQAAGYLTWDAISVLQWTKARHWPFGSRWFSSRATFLSSFSHTDWLGPSHVFTRMRLRVKLEFAELAQLQVDDSTPTWTR